MIGPNLCKTWGFAQHKRIFHCLGMKINSLPRNPARACVLTLRLSALGVSNERGGNLFLACRLILCETDNPPGWTGQSATLTHCQWKENKSHFSRIQRQRRKELRGNALDIWIRFDKSTLAVNIPVPSPKWLNQREAGDLTNPEFVTDFYFFSSPNSIFAF